MTPKFRSLIGALIFGWSLSVPAQSQILAGRIVDKASRTPVGNVEVKLARDTGATAPVLARVTTDSSGIFYLDVPGPGLYHLILVTATGAIFESPVQFESKDDEVQREFLLALPTKAYFAFQVEKQVAAMLGNPVPRYPERLRQENVQGEVLAQFVVDSLGEPEMATFRVLESPDPAFTAAVRVALSQSRFYPARVGGRPVKQLVQMPFVFSLNP